MAYKPKKPASKVLRLLQDKSQDSLWYLAAKKTSAEDPAKDLAMALNRSAKQREIANIPSRWRNYVYFREMTGRPSVGQLAYGMSKRPATFVSYYSSFQFSGIKSRFAASMADVYINRLLGHQTFISFIPDGGDFEQTKQCQEWEAWVEGGFDQLGYWQQRTIAGIEMIWYGTGVVTFEEDAAGNPFIGTAHPDEMLYSNPDDPNPYDVIRRRWSKKTELLEKYKANTAACEAIANAETAYPAFWFGSGTMDCTDVVPYLEAYTKPIGDEPGRHCVVIGDFTITDKDWEYPHPYELMQFNQMPGSMFGQGVAEVLLQVSQWIDGILTTMQEAEQRGGAGKWVYDENSNVNPDALGDTVAAAVSYLGKPPEYITPEGIGQWSLSHLDALMNLGRQIVHVSEQAVKGEAPKAFTSGVALEKYSEIDDQTFLEKIGRLEEFDRRCAYQLMMLGQRTNCNFIRKGQGTEVKWDELKWNPNYRISNIQAYNVGRLSQTVAGRIQVLKEMYAEKTIDKKLYIKFQQTPDIHGMFSELNSGADAIQEQLDELVKSDEYTPPTPWMDYDFAVMAVESRLNKEIARKSPQEVIDRLSLWRATVKNMQAQNATPPTIPAGPGAGTAPGMPGAAPVPPGPASFGFQPPSEAAPVAPIQPAPVPALNTAPGGLG